jgi:hypothetical protein
MSEFEKLIEAAKRGAVEEVRDLVQGHAEIVNQRDELGATALHHAAFGGHRLVVQVLVEHGAEINAADSEFGATPAGWAIEYLREMGGFLGIELDDFAFAIRRGDVEWVKRFLNRFPGLRVACTREGTPSSCWPIRLGIRRLCACWKQRLDARCFSQNYLKSSCMCALPSAACATIRESKAASLPLTRPDLCWLACGRWRTHFPAHGGT